MSLVIRNARVMTCDPGRPGLGVIDHGAVVIEDHTIAWVGEDDERPRDGEQIDLGGRLVTPGLVDCHTHAIFAGDRAHEFELRAAGKTYVEIQEAGGGIMATLGPTRAVPDEPFQTMLANRVQIMRFAGTTTMEIKSG